MLEADIKKENDSVFIVLEGQLDTLSAPGFDARLQPYLPGIKTLTIDFEKLSYISSAGLRVLLSAEQVLEENGAGPVKLLNVNKTIRAILEMTGFADVLIME